MQTNNFNTFLSQVAQGYNCIFKGENKIVQFRKERGTKTPFVAHFFDVRDGINKKYATFHDTGLKGLYDAIIEEIKIGD